MSAIKKTKAQKEQKEQTGRTGFSDVTKLMRDSFKYTIIADTEAKFLINLLDDILYKTLSLLDGISDSMRLRYQSIVRNYMFHPVDGRSSHSSKHPDSVLIGSLCWVHADTDWLRVVRERVSLFRIYWMDLIHELDNYGGQYLDTFCVDVEAEEYVAALSKRAELEKKLGVSSENAYGMAMELSNSVRRIAKIVRKLTYPYLRKVVTHAKHYGMDNPTTFMENYQNGSAGIRIAIGRHDCDLGAFASAVDRWINNRIMTFIRDNGMLVRVPDRAFTHKNIVDRHMSSNPLITLEEIAEQEGIKPKLLIESMMMVQSQTGYVDLQDEDESTSKHSHEYIDRSTDPDTVENTVNTTVQEYAGLLKPRERVLLALAYNIDDIRAASHLRCDVKRREQMRQVLAATMI